MLAVLRMGHRLGRDDRISTHCGLVARALGADTIIYSGEHDDKMMGGLIKVRDRFGGKFNVGYNKDWHHVIKDFKRRDFTVVHLTVYGMPLQKQISKIRKKKNVLVIVGGEKVPPEVYQLADYNISVTSQPHSEIAALSLFLYDYFGKKALEQKFIKPKIKVIPQEKGKKVIEK